MAAQTASRLRAAALRKQVLELGEDLLDGVQVGRVFGQEEQLGAGRADGPTHGPPLWLPRLSMTTMSPGLKRRDEDLLDIELERLAVDRAIEDPWGVDAVVPQRRHEGHGLPVAVRDLGLQPQAARRPAAQRRHVGLGPGLVDEDQAGGIDAALIGLPLRPPTRDVGALPFAGDDGFF